MICGRCSFYWLCASGWGSHQSIQNSKQKLKGATANVQNGPTLNISQYCVVSLCWFCASDWLDQRENSGRVFLQSQEVPSSRQDTTQGFLFDPRTLEPNINGPAFAEAIKHMRTMRQAGKARAGGNLQKEGCCVRENGAYRQQALYHQLVANPIIIWEMDFNGF